MNTLEQKLHDFIRRGFNHQFGKPSVPAKPDAEWAKVHATGTRLWLDTGDIEEAGKLWNTSFDALTTNNTLLNKEIQKGIYDKLAVEVAQVIRSAGPIDPQTLVLEIAFVLNAYHALRLVERFDANVSVELHTDLSNDVERSVAYGKRYFAICPERFIVKVPLTPAGYLAARRLVQAGIPINFTLGFSARHNYVAALLTNPKFVNVFMGRLNAYVADNKLGTGENVGEKATLATQRELIALRKSGRSVSNLIGASIRNGKQVGELAGLDVMTIPTKAAAEYRAKPFATVTSHVTDDPSIPLSAGVTLKQFNGETLWTVTPKFKDCVEALLKKDLNTITPAQVQDHFAAAGFGDFLPRWSAADVKTIAADGKIPIHAKWQSKLASGELGLDALMNLSALESFVTDQTALDDRLRSVLAAAKS
jgi:transaldolase